MSPRIVAIDRMMMISTHIMRSLFSGLFMSIKMPSLFVPWLQLRQHSGKS